MVEPATCELVRDADAGEVRVRIRGEVDLTAREPIQAAVAQAVQEPAEAVVLDLRDVTFVDSSGLSALLAAAKQARAAGRSIALEAPEGGEANLLIRLSGTAGALGLRR